MIFSLPWYGRTLVGTTDNDFEGDTVHPRPAVQEDVAYLLEATNDFFGTSLTESDLVGAYAGVRPLISTGVRKSVDRKVAGVIGPPNNFGLNIMSGIAVGRFKYWHPCPTPISSSLN